MDVALLRTFLALARHGHMTRASRELHLTQPAVSAQLRKLEDSLGQPLFERTPKGMTLTEAGELWRLTAQNALSELEAGQRALDSLLNLERGALRVGGGATATTYLLPDALGRFHSRYPGIQLFVREQGSEIVLESVLRGELELGIVTLPLQASAKQPLHIEPWIDDELCLIVPPGHALSSRQVFAWRELEGQSLVLFEAGSAVRALIDERLREDAIRTDIVMELRSIEAIKQMVRQGIGAAFVSRQALGPSEHHLTPQRDALRRELALIWRTDHALSAAARAFLETLTSRSGALNPAQSPLRHR